MRALATVITLRLMGLEEVRVWELQLKQLLYAWLCFHVKISTRHLQASQAEEPSKRLAKSDKRSS